MDDILLKLADYGPTTILSLVALVAIWKNSKKVEELGSNHMHEVKDGLDRLDVAIRELADCVRQNKDILIEIRAKLNGKR